MNYENNLNLQHLDIYIYIYSKVLDFKILCNFYVNHFFILCGVQIVGTTGCM